MLMSSNAQINIWWNELICQLTSVSNCVYKNYVDELFRCSKAVKYYFKNKYENKFKRTSSSSNQKLAKHVWTHGSHFVLQIHHFRMPPFRLVLYVLSADCVLSVTCLGWDTRFSWRGFSISSSECAPYRSNWDFFYPPKQLPDLPPLCIQRLLICLLGFWPRGQNPAGAIYNCNGSLFDSRQMKTRKKLLCCNNLGCQKNESVRLTVICRTSCESINYGNIVMYNWTMVLLICFSLY